MTCQSSKILSVSRRIDSRTFGINTKNCLNVNENLDNEFDTTKKKKMKNRSDTIFISRQMANRLWPNGNIYIVSVHVYVKRGKESSSSGYPELLNNKKKNSVESFCL